MIRDHDAVVRIIAVLKFEHNTKVAVAAYSRRRKKSKKELVSLVHKRYFEFDFEEDFIARLPDYGRIISQCASLP